MRRFCESLLLWKSKKYYILVGVCVCARVRACTGIVSECMGVRACFFSLFSIQLMCAIL